MPGVPRTMYLDFPFQIFQTTRAVVIAFGTMYVPAGVQIIETSDYIVFLHERMSWRIVAVDGRPHLPDPIRLWQGDSVDRWEGDTLVVDTINVNGQTWRTKAKRL